MNAICFVAIAFSYTMINLITVASSANLTAAGKNRAIEKRNKKLQRKVALILATDFACWVPFVLVCFLHTIEIMDATPWYQLFSIIILPINAVVNPILFDDRAAIFCEWCKQTATKILKNITTYFARDVTVEIVAIEMEIVNQVRP